MGTEATSWGLCWDLSAADSVAASQRWVLAAMQSHGPELVRLLWRILGNESDVCDAYQDTFVQLSRREQAPADVRAFVFRSAANTAISMLRRRRQQQRASERALQDGAAEVKADFGRDLDEQQLRDRLRGMVARLPERLRDVVVLKDLAELPYSHVSRMLGMSEATARVYRCRAIHLLGGWMARQEEDWL